MDATGVVQEVRRTLKYVVQAIACQEIPAYRLEYRETSRYVAYRQQYRVTYLEDRLPLKLYTYIVSFLSI